MWWNLTLPSCQEARVLPGQFGNLVRVLIPDAAATPMEFHDIILEDLVGTPDSQTKLIVPCQVTSLRRRWPSSVFAHMHEHHHCHCANPYYRLVNLTVVHGSSVMAAGLSLRDFSA